VCIMSRKGCAELGILLVAFGGVAAGLSLCAPTGGPQWIPAVVFMTVAGAGVFMLFAAAISSVSESIEKGDEARRKLVSDVSDAVRLSRMNSEKLGSGALEDGSRGNGYFRACLGSGSTVADEIRRLRSLIKRAESIEGRLASAASKVSKKKGKK